MRKRVSIETVAFGLVGATLLLSSPALAIDLGVSVNVGGVTVGGGVNLGNGGLVAGAGVNIGGNQGSPAAAVGLGVANPPAVADDPGQAAFALPAALAPSRFCGNGTSAQCVEENDSDGLAPEPLQAIAAVAGVPTAIVAACREGILEGAEEYEPVQVDVVSAGSVQRLGEGGQIAPLFVRIIYDSEGGHEIREARVKCQVDASGNAIALT